MLAPRLRQRVGFALRKLREARRMTQGDVAMELGTEAGNISRMESGKQEITQDRLEQICQALSVKPLDVYVIADTARDDASSSVDLVSLFRSATADQQKRILKYAKFVIQDEAA